MKPSPGPETGENFSLVPPGIKSLIIARARIVFGYDAPSGDAERAFEVMKVLTPNNIRFSDIRLAGGRAELEVAYSLPLSRLRFTQMIDVIKSSGVNVADWERLG